MRPPQEAASANSIFEIHRGQILQDEKHWAEAYAALDWRRHWVKVD